MSTERYYTLEQARFLFPRTPCKASVRRWVLYGIDGIHLEAKTVGVKWVTSEEACNRFVSELTAKKLADLEAKRGQLVLEA